MKRNFLNNLSFLKDLGFKDISPSGTDFVRTILYEKRIGEIDIRIQVHFTLTISDSPSGSYKENNTLDFENILLIDSLDNQKQTSITTSRELQRFLELLGDNN
jgi:hypothetical protein